MIEYISKISEEIRRIGKGILREGGWMFIPNGNAVGITSDGIYIYPINFDEICGEKQYQD